MLWEFVIKHISGIIYMIFIYCISPAYNNIVGYSFKLGSYCCTAYEIIYEVIILSQNAMKIMEMDKKKTIPQQL